MTKERCKHFLQQSYYTNPQNSIAMNRLITTTIVLIYSFSLLCCTRLPSIQAMKEEDGTVGANNVEPETVTKQNEKDERFFYAVESRDIGCAQDLLEQGANIDATVSGKTPLMVAIEGKHQATVVWLVDRDANLEKRYRGMTPFIFAIQNGDIDMVQLLVNLGANIHAKNALGNSALMIAAANGYLNIVQYLVEQLNANIDESYLVGSIFRTNALNLAQVNERRDVVNYLKEKGATDSLCPCCSIQ